MVASPHHCNPAKRHRETSGTQWGGKCLFLCLFLRVSSLAESLPNLYRNEIIPGVQLRHRLSSVPCAISFIKPWRWLYSFSISLCGV